MSSLPKNIKFKIPFFDQENYKIKTVRFPIKQRISFYNREIIKSQKYVVCSGPMLKIAFIFADKKS